MAQSGPNFAGTVAERTGDTGVGTWSGVTSAQGSTEATYATWNKPASLNAVSKPIEASAFGSFTGVDSGDTVNFVRVRVDTKVANTSRMDAFQVQLWNGTTAQIGATQTCTEATADTVDQFDFTGVTFAQLANLRVRAIGRGAAANNQTSTGTVDWISLTVDYTPAPQTLSVGQVVQAQTAQPVQRRKVVPVGQPTVLETAQAVTVVTSGGSPQEIPMNQTTTADAPLQPTRSKTYALGWAW